MLKALCDYIYYIIFVPLIILVYFSRKAKGSVKTDPFFGQYKFYLSPFSYGIPLAAGAVAFPIKPDTASIVSI